MQKTVEEMLDAIEKNNEQILNLYKTNKEIVKDLRERPEEDWDWVSVATASKKWDISQAMIYQRITRGKLKCRRFDNKIYVSLKDIKAIDDKVGDIQ